MTDAVLTNAGHRQPWIASAGFDLSLFILPGILALMLGALLPLERLDVWQWALLVVVIDTAHVYAMLFRTYFDTAELKARPLLYIGVPLVTLLIGMGFYAHDPVWFWRWLAYLTIFHFIRQQYGFTMIYGRFERDLPMWCRKLDQAMIYAAILCPLIHWHVNFRDFYFIVEGDFMAVDLGGWVAPVNALNLAAAVGIGGAWIGKEIWLLLRGRPVNVPRVSLQLLTAGIGLVALNLNLAYFGMYIIAHGIPYMALTYLFERKRVAFGESPYAGLFRHLLPSAALFVGLLLGFCYVEEGLWDSLVWHENGDVFGAFGGLSGIVAHLPLWLIAPLLAIPQVTHYVLDGFIWRKGLAGSNWPKILFGKPGAG